MTLEISVFDTIEAGKEVKHYPKEKKQTFRVPPILGALKVLFDWAFHYSNPPTFSNIEAIKATL